MKNNKVLVAGRNVGKHSYKVLVVGKNVEKQLAPFDLALNVDKGRWTKFAIESENLSQKDVLGIIEDRFPIAILKDGIWKQNSYENFVSDPFKWCRDFKKIVLHSSDDEVFTMVKFWM